MLLPNTTPNKNHIQMNANFVSMPSTSGISPNKTTSYLFFSALQTPQSSNKNNDQSSVKSQISPFTKGQTRIQMGITSSSSFVPYLRPPQNKIVAQSPVKSSHWFRSTGMPNNTQERKSFSAFHGIDGLYYQSLVKDSPDTISPMKLPMARPNLTPNASLSISKVRPKIQVVHKSTPNTTPTMNKMPRIQYPTTLDVVFKWKSTKIKLPAIVHQTQAKQIARIRCHQYRYYRLLPSRISQDYTNDSHILMQKSNSDKSIQKFIHSSTKYIRIRIF